MSPAPRGTRVVPRKRDAEATRAAILAAAKAQFGRSGYDRAVLRDIAAEAGGTDCLHPPPARMTTGIVMGYSPNGNVYP